MFLGEGVGTSTGEGGGASLLNLCPVSCDRKLARGSGEFMIFEFDRKEGKMRYTIPADSYCHRYAA